MPDPSVAAPEDVEAYLVEIDRHLRGIQLRLAPEREPAPAREPRVVDEPPPAAPPPRSDPDGRVTSKLIASMRELLDALESATTMSDHPANH
jgi:hypothetical protein